MGAVQVTPNPPKITPAYGHALPYTSPTGVQTYLYFVGTAADAIGRTTQTLRKWEIAGTIPTTPFKQHGKRLYSEEHIEALVRCAEKYHVRAGSQISTAFKRAIYREFDLLNKYFFEKE